MSKRLYYTAAYQTQFNAKISERIQSEDGVAIVLDQTCFYPESGGQPADVGMINGVRVTALKIREADGAILHYLADEMWDETVVGKIYWERRFDHMQQHSGQHILSQAFLQVAEANTVGFHMSADKCTIDLDRIDLTGPQIEQAELLANQIIWENRPITVRSVKQKVAQYLELRKLPDVAGEMVRLVEIKDFDLSACGGTHVSATGAVGLIKIVKLERRGKKIRIEFCCGKRALTDYRQKNSVGSRLNGMLSTGIEQIVPAVEKLQQELKASRRLMKKQDDQLFLLEAAHLWAQGKKVGKAVIIAQVFTDDTRTLQQLRHLAKQLTSRPGAIVLFGLSGSKSHLVFCRGEKTVGEMNKLIKPALQLLGTASGGGTAAIAQGGGPAADKERVELALQRAEKLLMNQLQV